MAHELLIINSRFLDVGGGETYVKEVMRHFADKGWEVHLATRPSRQGPGEWNGCRIHYIDGLDDVMLAPTRCLAPLRKMLDEVQPTVVQVQNLMNFFAYASVVSRGEFKSVLFMSDTPLLPKRLFGRLGDYETERRFAHELLATGKCSKVLFMSEYYRNSYVQAVPMLREMSEVLNGFAAELPPAAHMPSLAKDDAFTVLFPSRMVPRKGVEDCLQALALLPSDVELLLPAYAAGTDAVFLKRLNGLMEALDVQDRVRAAETLVSPEHMAAYYKAADVTVIPSHYEGLGLVALESMARGVPVVASAVGGLTEIVTSEQDGLLVEPHQPQALADAVRRLRADQNLAQRLAQEARRTVATRFSRHTHMDRLEAVYAAL